MQWWPLNHVIQVAGRDGTMTIQCIHNVIVMS